MPGLLTFVVVNRVSTGLRTPTVNQRNSNEQSRATSFTWYRSGLRRHPADRSFWDYYAERHPRSPWENAA